MLYRCLLLETAGNDPTYKISQSHHSKKTTKHHFQLPFGHTIAFQKIEISTQNQRVTPLKTIQNGRHSNLEMSRYGQNQFTTLGNITRQHFQRLFGHTIAFRKIEM